MGWYYYLQHKSGLVFKWVNTWDTTQCLTHNKYLVNISYYCCHCLLADFSTPGFSPLQFIKPTVARRIFRHWLLHNILLPETVEWCLPIAFRYEARLLTWQSEAHAALPSHRPDFWSTPASTPLLRAQATDSQGSISDSLIFLLLSVLVDKFSQARGFNTFLFLLTKCKISLSLTWLFVCLFLWFPPLVIHSLSWALLFL